MEIRRPKVSDAKKVSELLFNTIENINSKDHTSEQIKSWTSRNSVERLKKKFQDKSGSIFVLINKGKIVGYLRLFLESKSIASLYIKHTEVGTGHGKRLLKYAEEFAKQNGLDELKLDSSTTALNFYKSHGYVPIKESHHESDGVIIPVIQMVKKL